MRDYSEPGAELADYGQSCEVGAACILQARKQARRG